MSMPFHDFTPDAAGQAAITPEDILALRRSVWQNGLIDGSEAQAILALNASITEPTVVWTDFFVEALAVWLVEQQDPRGYVADADADWLIARLDRDGVRTMAELELLVRVLEKAIAAPDHLRQFALAQIERAVIEGGLTEIGGPARAGGTPEPGQITVGEARLLRRLILSSGGDRPAGVSRAEAELLFRLKDATLAADNAPEWKQLFVQGVGNYLKATSGAQPLSRERERELGEFIATPESGLGGFLGRMARTQPNGFASASRDVLGFGRKPVARAWDAEFERAAAIDPEEHGWLDAQVEADGRVDDYEQALLDFLKQG